MSGTFAENQTLLRERVKLCIDDAETWRTSGSHVHEDNNDQSRDSLLTVCAEVEVSSGKEGQYHKHTAR